MPEEALARRNVLFALQVMADLGRLGDPRCTEALGLLESKWLPLVSSPRFDGATQT